MTHVYHTFVAIAIVGITACSSGGVVTVTTGSGGMGGSPATACTAKSGCEDGGTGGGSQVLGCAIDMEMCAPGFTGNCTPKATLIGSCCYNGAAVGICLADGGAK